LNTIIEASRPDTPERRPLFVVTGWVMADSGTASAITARAAKRLLVNIPFSFLSKFPSLSQNVGFEAN
jgi:hypothetical protein